MIKKIYFLAFCCLLLSSHPLVGQQNVFPAHEEDATWRLREGSGPPYLSEVYTASPEDVCGQMWTPVFSEADTAGAAPVHIGYYRVEGRHVYYRPDAACPGQETVMYDFDLLPGDQFQATFYGAGISSTVDMTVLSIQETEYMGVLRREWLVLYPLWFSFPTIYGSMRWVEGIGANKHPFYVRYDLPNGQMPHVTCFFNDDGLWYKVPYLQTDTCPSARFYVNQAATGLPVDGSSWHRAFRRVQDALEVARSGDEVWVAAGTYRPTDTNDRALSFRPRPGVALYGGFAGVELSLEDRSPADNVTILTGDIGVPELMGDNSFHVIHLSGSTGLNVIDGFTVTKGNASGQGALDSGNGGGLLISPNTAYPIAAPYIRNCVFQMNHALRGGGIYMGGDGPFSASPTVENCAFLQNRALDHGGGILQQGASAARRLHTIQGCHFEGNTTVIGWGGAVHYGGVDGDYALRECHFVRDSALSGFGGGLTVFPYPNMMRGANLNIDGCIFTDSYADEGGAIAVLNLAPLTTPDRLSLSLSRSNFSVPGAPWNSLATGVYVDVLGGQFDLSIEDCAFTGVTSPQAVGTAVNVWRKWGMRTGLHINRTRFVDNAGQYAIRFRGDWPGDTVAIRISNSLFSGNGGGALSVEGGLLNVVRSELVNCTFNENGAGLFHKSWSPAMSDTGPRNEMLLSNCVLWAPSLSLEQMFRNRIDTPADPMPNLYRYDIRHCLLNAVDTCNMLGGETACSDNIFGAEPGFTDPSAGDFRPKACSPLVNAGNNGVLDSIGLVSDLGGQARLLDAIVDIGAYEVQALLMEVDTIGHVACPDGQDGFVEVSTNSHLPLTYTWVLDSIIQGEGSTGLMPGEYALTVSDPAGCIRVFEFSVDGPTSFEVFYDPLPASSGDANDGEVRFLSATGGTPPYSYLWSNGATTPSLEAVTPGDYILTLTDSLGCSAAFSFVVDFTNEAFDWLSPRTWMRVWPNPATTWVDFDMRLPGGISGTRLLITDLNGREVARYTDFLPQRALRWDTGSLPPGLYVYQLSADGLEPLMGRVILVREP